MNNFTIVELHNDYNSQDLSSRFYHNNIDFA
jgi:hypothetical protein